MAGRRPGRSKPQGTHCPANRISEGPGKSKRSLGQYSLLHAHRQEGNACAEDEAAERDAVYQRRASRMDFGRSYTPRYPKTLGWTHGDKPVVGPGLVLDPFGGTGTTGHVSVLLGRRFVGIDLYQEYSDRMAGRCEEAFERLGQACSPEPPTCTGGTPLRGTFRSAGHCSRSPGISRLPARMYLSSAPAPGLHAPNRLGQTP